MVDFLKYDKALIVSSDGDFYSLVKHLYQCKKLLFAMSPYIKTCSTLLKKEAKEKILFIDNLRKNLKINEKAPPRDRTRGSAFSCEYVKYSKRSNKSRQLIYSQYFNPRKRDFLFCKGLTKFCFF